MLFKASEMFKPYVCLTSISLLNVKEYSSKPLIVIFDIVHTPCFKTVGKLRKLQMSEQQMRQLKKRRLISKSLELLYLINLRQLICPTIELL